MGKPNMKAQLERRLEKKQPPKTNGDASLPESHKQRCPSRQGQKMIAGYFDPMVHRQLKMLCLEEDTTIQELLTDALNGLFTDRGKPPIA